MTTEQRAPGTILYTYDIADYDIFNGRKQSVVRRGQRPEL